MERIHLWFSYFAGLLNYVVSVSLLAKDGFYAVIERFFTFLASFTTRFDLLGAFLVILPN